MVEKTKTKVALDAERFFSRSNQMFAMLETNGTFLRVNQSWMVILGYSEAELIGNPFEMLLHADCLSATRSALKKLRKGQEITELEARVICKNGTSKWLSWGAVTEPKEKLIYLAAHDISERKQIEHDWANTSAALENAVEGVARVDSYGRFTSINHAFAEHLGYRPEELLGAHWHVSVHPEDVPKLQEAQELMSAHGKAELEARGIKSDGSLSHSQIVLVKALDQANQFVGHHCFMKDISARKQAELSLQKTESRLSSLLRHVPGVLYQLIAPTVDSFHFSYVSESCSNILGYRPVEFTEHHELACTCLHPDDLPSLRETMTKSARSMQPFRIELRCFKKSGEMLWVLLSSSPERLGSGVLIWNGLITDITEMKLAEEKIKQLNEDLAQRIEVLAMVNEELETLTRKLEVAYGQAMEASRIKSEFVANISHEVRTPISAVIGMSELLMDSILSPDQEQLARVISESAQSLLTIINDILDFSKMEAGRVRLESIGFKVSELVQGCTNWLRARAEEKGLSMITELDKSIPAVVKGDPLRIRQILLNLVTNAVKFTSSGQIKVRTCLASKTDSQVRIRFEVIDTGIGLREDARTQLFLPFSQADGSTTRKYGGTGLGLSISKHLVELMGGEIGVASDTGHGCAFWFELPLLIADAQEYFDDQESDAGTAELRRAAEKGLSDGSSGQSNRFQTRTLERIPQEQFCNQSKVLLAEDNPVLQELAMRQLRRLGLVVDVVANGKEAVAAVAKTSYDLIFMDCQMPEMDGFEATTVIREEEAKTGEHKLIIALTASAMDSDRARCLERGMDDYLSKPVRLRQLIEIIEKWNPLEQTNQQQTERSRIKMTLFNEESRSVTNYTNNGTNSETAESAIDLRTLKGMYGEDATTEILEMFTEEANGLVEQMDGFTARQEPGPLASVAHQLKGVSASVLANALSHLAGQMEIEAKQKDWDEIKKILNSLKAENSRISIFVKEVLKHH
jgi:PAS domain S-box-containing protein